MTREAFRNFSWGAGQRVRIDTANPERPIVMEVVCVNFDQDLIATADDPEADAEDWYWWRCEYCSPINPDKQ